jgi:hypothetical protein
VELVVLLVDMAKQWKEENRMSIKKKIIKSITERAKEARGEYKPSASAQRQLAKKEAGSKAANQKRINKAGSNAVAPSVRAQMRKEGTFVGTIPRGAKPRKEMSNLEGLEYDFDGFEKELRESLVDKVQRGEKAIYKGVDYTFMLSEKKGHKPIPSRVGKPAPKDVKPARRKGPKQESVSLAGPKRFGGQGTKTEKSYGGKVTKKAMGGKIGRGCGAALRGAGKVMK